MKIIITSVKICICMVASMALAPALALTEDVNGRTWTYTVSGSTATITGFTPRTGHIEVPEKLGSCSVITTSSGAFKGYTGITSVVLPESMSVLGSWTFENCSNIQKIDLPSKLKTIGAGAFKNCSSLSVIIIPASVTKIENGLSWYDMTWVEHRAFAGCSHLQFVVFDGLPPDGFAYSGLGNPPSGYQNGWVGVPISYKREYAEQWTKYVGMEKFACYYRGHSPNVMLSAVMRKNDPTVLDVTYRAISAKPTVKVRALAFVNGTRSLSNLLRPEAFIEGTEENVGDNITANVEHKLSWKISSDWDVDLSKVSMEILVRDEDGLIPLEMMDLPHTSNHNAMQISWNSLTSSMVYEALMWLYASRDENLRLENGNLKWGAHVLASAGGLSNSGKATEYVFSKMGFSVLSGPDLAYAKQLTRLALSPSGAKQYAMKPLE